MDGAGCSPNRTKEPKRPIAKRGNIVYNGGKVANDKV